MSLADAQERPFTVSEGAERAKVSEGAERAKSDDDTADASAGILRASGVGVSDAAASGTAVSDSAVAHAPSATQ